MGPLLTDECGVCDGPGADIECWDGSYECDVADCSDEPTDCSIAYCKEYVYTSCGGSCGQTEKKHRGRCYIGGVGYVDECSCTGCLFDGSGSTGSCSGDHTALSYNIAAGAGARVDCLEHNECIYSGCTDASACNYDSGASTDDGSCLYVECNNGSCVSDESDCPPDEVEGCTTNCACNFDPDANTDDGSCDFNCCDQDPGECNILSWLECGRPEMQAQCMWAGGGFIWDYGPCCGHISDWCELTESGVNYTCDDLCNGENEEEECDDRGECYWHNGYEECRFTDTLIPGECVNNPDYDTNCCTNPGWCSDPDNNACLGGPNSYSCFCGDNCQCEVNCCTHPSACDNCKADCTCGPNTPPSGNDCWQHGVWICEGKPDGPVIA